MMVRVQTMVSMGLMTVLTVVLMMLVKGAMMCVNRAG